MKRLAILFLLSATVASAATPIRTQPMPRTDDTITYRFTEPDWHLGGGVSEITGDHGFLSPPVALSLGSEPAVWSSAYHTLFPAKVGVPYLMTVWVNGDKADASQPLEVMLGSFGMGGFFVYSSFDASDVGPGWQRYDVGVFVQPPYYNPDFMWFGIRTQTAYGALFGRWLVGQIEFREIEPTVSDSE